LARRARLAAVTFTACLVAVQLIEIASGAASHRVISVFPGNNAIQRSLARARDGDTLLIHSGHYFGRVTVTKRVTLLGAKGSRPLIDGRCKTNDTIEIKTPGVVVARLAVVGAAEGFGLYPSEVNFTSVPSGRAQDLVVRDTCNAEYGINIVQGGEQQIVRNRVSGFSDSGIYAGQIKSTHGGALRIEGNETLANSRGIIVEFSSGVDIRVIGNYMHDNRLRGLGETPPSGLLINGANDVLIRNNRANRNGTYGIDFIASSQHNRLFGNDFRNNPQDVRTETGSGSNCGAGNRPNPFPPC
jgi:parallel beta-helix repeat protein